MSKTYTRSFAAGELSPQLFGRLDLAKNQTALAKCLNFLVTPQGPVQNRPGLEYVLKIRSTTTAVLIPFSFNTEQTFALEFGPYYVRFHTQGATLLRGPQAITDITAGVFTVNAHGRSNGEWVYLQAIGGMTALNGRWGVVTGATANTFQLRDLFGATISTAGLPAYTSGGTISAVYEITTPYAEAHLKDLHYVQSADVLTIVHPSYAPRELRRLGVINWQLAAISFLPTVGTPAAPNATAPVAVGGTPVAQSYVTTAIARDTLEESLPSPVASVSNDLTVAGNYNVITPSPLPQAIRYNVFKLENGLYGVIGQTEGADFRDDNIFPDVLQTPPQAADPFAVGAITEVPVTGLGSGYGSVPRTGGVIDTVTITAAGAGYIGPTATAAGGGSGATFAVGETAGAVDSLTITTGGTLYASPTIAIADGAGTGATATATATPIVEHSVTLTVTDATGTGCELAPVVSGGFLIAVRVVKQGHGYTAPVVSVTDGAGGSGATFGAPILTYSTVNPGAVSYFEQRRAFGGSTINPQTVWMTRSATENNMSYSIPTQDDDAITARIVAREANRVRHLVPLNDLLVLTSGGVWRVSSAGGGALTPATFNVRQQSNVGASNVQPVVTAGSVLYAQDRGAHMREVAFDWQSQSYQSGNLSVLAPHLFDYMAVVQMAYAQAPVQTLWAVRSDGILLGLTYQPEHEVKAWHQHSTQGTFESVCAVAEGTEDGVYVIVKRRINGRDVRYVERMHTRRFDTAADAFFVDSGLSYSGAETSSVGGLHHLEGATVAILADGGVSPPQVVADGAVALDAPASKVHVGLPYTSDMQSMPLSYEAEAFGQGVVKNINQVALRLYRSSSIQAGPSFDALTPYAQRSVLLPHGTPPPVISEMINLNITPQWQQDGSVCIRHADPLPLEIASMSLDVSSGG